MVDHFSQLFNTLAERLADNLAPVRARLATHGFRLRMLEDRVKAAPEGPPGPRGEIGPMPAHRWDGSKLQFEQAPGGEWGEEMDLRGPAGPAGRNGANGRNGGGGSRVVNSYFPSGW